LQASAEPKPSRPASSVATIVARAARRSSASPFLYGRRATIACARRRGYASSATRPGSPPWQRHAGVDQARHALVIHQADRNVARLHRTRRRDRRRRVGAAMEQARAARLRVAPGVDERAPRHPAGAAAAHRGDHFGGAAAQPMRVDERARQSERQVEAAEPRARRSQHLLEGSEGRQRIDRVDDDAVALDAPARDRDRLSARRAAREVDAEQRHGSEVACWCKSGHRRRLSTARRAPTVRA